MVIVEGKIQPKQRPRVARGIAYTPKETKVYEEKIKQAYQEQSNKRFNGLLSLNVKFYFKVPTSYSKRRTDLIKDRYCNNNKDLDNCIKSILDGLNGVAYEDDKQVVKINAIKIWTTNIERVEFELKEIDYYE